MIDVSFFLAVSIKFIFGAADNKDATDKQHRVYTCSPGWGPTPQWSYSGTAPPKCTLDPCSSHWNVCGQNSGGTGDNKCLHLCENGELPVMAADPDTGDQISTDICADNNKAGIGYEQFKCTCASEDDGDLVDWTGKAAGRQGQRKINCKPKAPSPDNSWSDDDGAIGT